VNCIIRLLEAEYNESSFVVNCWGKVVFIGNFFWKLVLVGRVECDVG